MALGSDPGGNHGQFLLSGRCKAMRIRSVGSRHTNTRSLAVSFFFFFRGKPCSFDFVFHGWFPQLSTFCVPVCCCCLGQMAVASEKVLWKVTQLFSAFVSQCCVNCRHLLLLNLYSSEKDQWFCRCWGSLSAYFTSCRCLELGPRDTGIVVVGGKDHLNAGRFVFEPQFAWSDFGVPKFASRLGFG